MIVRKIDPKNKFVSMFDTESGKYMRTGILDKDGHDTNVDPFMTSFPELLDIGIMGHCVHSKYCGASGIQCYQGGPGCSHDNMTLENFKKIIDQCKGKVFQVALGGHGDPNMHENFEEILKYCRENNIVPNFTTSGLELDSKMIALCKEYCGAVAVSWHNQPYTYSALRSLIEAGVKTNIHCVLSNHNIKEIDLLMSIGGIDFPQGLNAIVFLLHKPVGLGQEDNMLSLDDDRVKRFFHYVDTMQYHFKIGFDSCSVPGIINSMKSVDFRSIDTCEGGRWSAYISSDMKMMPCSFDNQDLKWAVDLNEHTIQEAWDSPQFEDFRSYFKHSCMTCKDREFCMGGCPIKNQIVLCNRAERYHTNESTVPTED